MPTSKRPKKGTLLDYAALRSECERVISESGLTLSAVGAAVVEAMPERDRLTTSAVSNAKNSEGGGVAKLQADIIATLSGASISGPFFQVD